MTKIEKAKQLRKALQLFAETLDDAQALEIVSVYPEWTSGQQYTSGDRVCYDDRLYRCLQPHTAQADWTPTAAASLWVEISLPSDGGADSPIAYNNNMELESGKYYTQDGVTYLCTRDTGTPVYNPLSALVGLYVEVVS